MAVTRLTSSPSARAPWVPRYQLARRIMVTGIDRFTPPHVAGRATARAASRDGDGRAKACPSPFAHEICELRPTQPVMLSPIGGLIVGRRSDSGLHGQAAFVGRTIAAANRFCIEHEVLTPGEVTKRFPQFCLEGDETCYYEPGAGFLRPELCVATQIDRARALGAAVRTGESVTRVTADATSVTVVSDAATYTAGRVIVTAGAWVPQLLGSAYAKLLRVYPQTVYWFAPDDEAAFTPERFPIFIWRHGTGENDHLRTRRQRGCEAGTEGSVPSTPDDVRRAISTADAGGARGAGAWTPQGVSSLRALRASTP